MLEAVDALFAFVAVVVVVVLVQTFPRIAVH